MLDFLSLKVDPLSELGSMDADAIYLRSLHPTNSFGKAINAVGAPPCERGCPWLNHCRDQRLACASFAEYVRSGCVDKDPGDVPTRKRFIKIYSGG